MGMGTWGRTGAEPSGMGTWGRVRQSHWGWGQAEAEPAGMGTREPQPHEPPLKIKTLQKRGGKGAERRSRRTGPRPDPQLPVTQFPHPQTGVTPPGAPLWRGAASAGAAQIIKPGSPALLILFYISGY